MQGPADRSEFPFACSRIRLFVFFFTAFGLPGHVPFRAFSDREDRMLRARRLLVLFSVTAGVPLAVACSSGPNGTGTPGPNPTTTGTTTATGTSPTATATTTVVPPGGCPDPGICGPGLYWDPTACRCQDGPPPPPTGTVLPPPPPTTVDAGPPMPACFVPGYGECFPGETCVIAYCPNGGEDACYCAFDGMLSCYDSCGIDAGPPPPFDAGPPPPPDAGLSCYIPGYGDCPSGTTCNVGTCPDGRTPVTCFCADGQAYCNGACTPFDAGRID
jgi:hypothetical protein